MKTIKYSVGQPVFWLSSKGFEKGIIKSIIYTDELIDMKNKTRRHEKLVYRLTSKNYAEVYQGDEVPEELIFTSYENMLAHYAKHKPSGGGI
jgi:hypothetical protein